jgi:hypothetical protein
MLEKIPTDRSARIFSWGWEDGTLEITFQTGGTYRYDGVTQSTWDALQAAPSSGKAFDLLIKGSFPYTKVS